MARRKRKKVTAPLLDMGQVENSLPITQYDLPPKDGEVTGIWQPTRQEIVAADDSVLLACWDNLGDSSYLLIAADYLEEHGDWRYFGLRWAGAYGKMPEMSRWKHKGGTEQRGWCWYASSYDNDKSALPWKVYGNLSANANSPHGKSGVMGLVWTTEGEHVSEAFWALCYALSCFTEEIHENYRKEMQALQEYRMSRQSV